MKRENAGQVKKEKQSRQRRRFRVLLHRSYIVDIVAQNEDKAMHYTEFFINDPIDASTEKEKQEHNFKIEKIEMAYNDASEILK